MFERFHTAMEIISSSYVQETDAEELFQGAMRGLVGELDQYSGYTNAEVAAQGRNRLEGRFYGIGAQIGWDEKSRHPLVLSPLYDTPAYHAGLKAGDLILAIDGQPTKELSLSETVNLIKGPRGEPVELLVKSTKQQVPRDVTIVRDEIRLKTVLGDLYGPDGQWEYFLPEAPKIAYIELTTFNKNTTEELQTAIAGLLEQGMAGLVLDLRQNPGGLLDQAIQVCDLFIPGGETIVSTSGRASPLREYTSQETNTFPDFPLVVLVNQYSASASEIVAACLQDHQRAVIVGERTWGKGSVQTLFRQPGGDELRLTVATYVRPSGKNIHKFEDATEDDQWGVLPNPGYEVTLTNEELREIVDYRRDRSVLRPSESAVQEKRTPTEVDPQLKRAVEVLQEMISQNQKSD